MNASAISFSWIKPASVNCASSRNAWRAFLDFALDHPDHGRGERAFLVASFARFPAWQNPR